MATRSLGIAFGIAPSNIWTRILSSAFARLTIFPASPIFAPNCSLFSPMDWKLESMLSKRTSCVCQQKSYANGHEKIVQCQHGQVFLRGNCVQKCEGFGAQERKNTISREHSEKMLGEVLNFWCSFWNFIAETRKIPIYESSENDRFCHNQYRGAIFMAKKVCRYSVGQVLHPFSVVKTLFHAYHTPLAIV